MPLSQNNLGQSKFPPNPKQWPAERNGLKLRSDFGRLVHVPLKPFELAGEMERVTLVDREAFEGIIGPDCSGKLHGMYRDTWSGFVVPVDGQHLVIINSTHAKTRQHATLAEELFHIRLRHQPCRLLRCPVTGLMKRQYTPEIEHEAYWSAGAALVPYVALRQLVVSGTPIEKIAEMFDVSVQLVQMRMKLTKLWRRRGC